MANKKITELTEATSITGTDILPIVNGGITKKVKVDTLVSFVNPDATLKTLSANWENTYTTVKATSANWDSVYSNVNANSASYATIDFANSKFFALTGGRIDGNVTIFGNLTSTGTQTFANTIFSTTSSLSVVHIGEGPAVWIGNNGSGDIASFNDIDQGVEMLHVGGVNSTSPNVGVKTSNPNKTFTVNGEISANNTIWDADGNSNQWNSVYSSVKNTSANLDSVYASWNSASATSIVDYNDARFSKLSSQVYTFVNSTTSINTIYGSNSASGYMSNVAGGRANTASGLYSNVAGGWDNAASGLYSNVAGGYTNTASGSSSNVAGGLGNTASGCYSNVAGGASNTASGLYSNVAGGDVNVASGNASTVVGGRVNTASGNYSAILGGNNNNTNNQCNTFILGSNITASQPNFTYVNNLSSSGAIFANTFRVGNHVAATGPVGTIARKVQIFNSAGVSIGFIPVYNTIT